MNILGYLNSLNKISLLVLIGMFIFLLYEVYLFQKERERKKIVSVPSFNPQSAVVAPIKSKQPSIKPVPPPVQRHVEAQKKPRKSINKKAVGAVLVSVVMAAVIGLISFRLSQTSPQSSVNPARPRAATLPTSSPSPFNSPAPKENVSPTTKPPLLLARSLATAPTRLPEPTITPEVTTPTPKKLAQVTQLNPTSEPTPTIMEIPTSTPTQISPKAPTAGPTVMGNLPQSGASQYAFIFAGIAFFIILVSFLY